MCKELEFMASMIEQIVQKTTEYKDKEKISFLILEATGLPFFIQIAKVSEDYLLDVPRSVLYGSVKNSVSCTILLEQGVTHEQKKNQKVRWYSTREWR